MLIRFLKKVKTADSVYVGDMNIADEAAVAFIKQGKAIPLDPAYSFDETGNLIDKPSDAKEYTQDEIVAMKLTELRALVKSKGIACHNWGKAKLIAYLLGDD